MTDIIVPCKNCLLIPICRHKPYKILLRKCSCLFELLYIDNHIHSGYRTPEFEKTIIEVFEVINPEAWFIDYKDSYKGGFSISPKLIKRNWP